MKGGKYGVVSLRKEFPTDEACLEFIFDAIHSRECSCGGTYKRRAGRKSFQCSKCRAHISPTAGTIFNKSDTPLTLWFHAIMVFSNAKSGISAKQLQRELEVTYKCAWRMLTLIKKALKQDDRPLSGVVEMDMGYIGGRFKSGKYNERQKEAIAAKSIVMAAVERGGDIRVKIVESGTVQSHATFLHANVERGSSLMTDATSFLNKPAIGYNRQSVRHKRGEYARGDVHVNTVETFWAHVKRSIRGTHKGVSKKWLQTYLDAFVWQYNERRHNDAERFGSLLGALLQPAR
jgi:transposase